MTVLDYVEFGLSKLLSSVRGHEAGRFCKGPAFATLPEPNIKVESHDCGASGSALHLDYTQEGKDLFPELKWAKPEGLEVGEWLLFCEDVDAPLPVPITHGFYYAIPATKTSVVQSDFITTEDGKPSPNSLKGGFKYGANLRKTVYNGPRALKGHGPHRYYFQVVALHEPLDYSCLSPVVTKKELAVAVQGKVIGWGEWIGVSERKFE